MIRLRRRLSVVATTTTTRPLAEGEKWWRTGQMEINQTPVAALLLSSCPIISNGLGQEEEEVDENCGFDCPICLCVPFSPQKPERRTHKHACRVRPPIVETGVKCITFLLLLLFLLLLGVVSADGQTFHLTNGRHRVKCSVSLLCISCRHSVSREIKDSPSE